MAVYLGNNKITFGISEIYVGSNKVYSATPPGPPVIDNPVNEYFCVYSAKSFTIRFETINTASGASATLIYDNLKLKYSTDKTNWTQVSAAQGFNFNGGTLYYIYTSSAEVGTLTSDTDLGRRSASWGQVCCAPAYGYYSYTSTRMKFSGTSTIYLMGNIRTIAQGNQATPYNSYVGSKTKIDYVGSSVYSSSYSMYYTRACGLGSSTYQSSSSSYTPQYLRARGISNIRGTSNSIIDINNLFIGDHEELSYPSFTYATGTPYTPPYDPINDYFWIENRKSSSDTIRFTFIAKPTSSNFSPTISTNISDFFYYSTDKSTWTPHNATNLTIPANTRYYFYSNRKEGPSQKAGSVSSGKAYPYFDSFGGLNAAAKINGSFQNPSLFANLGFGGNASSNLAIGGNIRTLLGKGKGGVGNTSLIERGSKYSLSVSSYNECAYIGYTALGTSSTSFSNSQRDLGLFFTGITDAGNLYIGNSDHEAEFSLITPTTLPIYT